MTENPSRWCVLLPCSASESWAVPQNCLAEIVTVQEAPDQPPQHIDWRGETIPVLDFGRADGPTWRDSHGSGLIAVILGLHDEACAYWAVAVRGKGLHSIDIGKEELEDLPDEALEHASAAFRLRETVYQVPELSEMQQQIGQILEMG